MKNTKQATSESSFAGFLESYSKGNTATAKSQSLSSIYAPELKQLAEALNGLSQTIHSFGMNTPDILSALKDLEDSTQMLNREETTINDKLLYLSDKLESSILLYNTLRDISNNQDKIKSLRRSLNSVIFYLMTITKRIGGENLLKNVIMIAQKI